MTQHSCNADTCYVGVAAADAKQGKPVSQPAASTSHAKTETGHIEEMIQKKKAAAPTKTGNRQC